MSLAAGGMRAEPCTVGAPNWGAILVKATGFRTGVMDERILAKAWVVTSSTVVNL